jgi:uncharacterized protein DUF2313
VAAVADKGGEMLEDLPLGADDPTNQAILRALGRELERIEAAGRAIAEASKPSGATDAYRLLGVWEMTLGLPVERPGTSLAERQAAAVAALRRRQAARALDWRALLTQAIGSTNWDHIEISPYQVTVILPVAGATYTAQRVAELAREITPANLVLGVVFDAGFVLSESQVGVSAL